MRLRLASLFGLACALLAAAQPAAACRITRPIDLELVRSADAVVVGRISGYNRVREGYRRYARFNVHVEKQLIGRTPGPLRIEWTNSTFAEPEAMPPGPYLIALRKPGAGRPPQSHPGKAAAPEFTILQRPCSKAFILPATSPEAIEIMRILRTVRR
jgi:hypothetical protein